MSTVNVWSGAVTSNSAWVRAKVTGSSTRLAVADNPGLSGPAYYGPVTPTGDGIASLTATGLDADTPYWYQLEDDSVLDSSVTGRFRTHGTVGEPYPFTFAAASCGGSHPTNHYQDWWGPSSCRVPYRMSNHPVFDDIAASGALFFLHLGDRGYYNLGGGGFGIPAGVDASDYRGMYDDCMSCTRQAGLHAAMPVAYVWDDHDFGPNDSDDSDPGAEYAAQVYRERCPHYDLPAPGGDGDSGIYHSFQVGRVLFVVLDERYYRDPPSDPAPRAMLGAAQLAWADTTLAAGAGNGAELLILVSTQRWNAGDEAATATWKSYEEDRSQLLASLGDHKWLDRMLVVHGDNHAMGIDSGAGNPFGGFPMLCYSPLDSGPNLGPVGDFDRGGRAQRGQYGTVRVDDYGPVLDVTCEAVFV